MEEVKNIIRPFLKTKTTSTFYQDGKLTPAEFLAAGDLLQRQAPIWKWESGDPKKRLDFLPSDKQFLIARHIPCRARANSHLSGTVRVNAPSPAEDDFGFTAVEKTETAPPKSEPAPTSAADEEEEDSDDVVDGDEDIPDIKEDEDQAVAKPKPAATTRIYEASITYDKYYSSPRFWLRGVDADGTPLTQQQIFEDISDEHARKTVTIETHHHLNLPFASIHPCKHAHTMKMMMEMARDGKAKGKDDEEAEPIPVDQYFVFFLKFIATICPTMDIDFTSAARL